MTIQEAIRQAERVIEGGRVAPEDLRLPNHDKHMAFMEAMLAAAKKGAAEELQAERDEVNEKSKQLTLETVGRAMGCCEETLGEVQNEQLCMVSEGHRFGMVIEPAMHTALAALRKVQLDLASDGIDDEANPRVRVVHVKNTDKKSMEEILKQVEGDLEKIFAEREAK